MLWVDGKTAPYHLIWIGLVTGLSILAALELIELLNQSIAKPYGKLMTASTATCLSANGFSGPLGLDGYTAFSPLAIIFGFCILAILITGVRDFDEVHPVMPRLAATVFGVSYIGILGSFLTQLRFFHGPTNGIIALGTGDWCDEGHGYGSIHFR